MTDNPDRTPIQKEKRNPFTSWAFIAGLFGAGALPCPGCGVPLAWHLRPLALLILFVRIITTRARTRHENKSSPETTTAFAERRDP